MSSNTCSQCGNSLPVGCTAGVCASCESATEQTIITQDEDATSLESTDAFDLSIDDSANAKVKQSGTLPQDASGASPVGPSKQTPLRRFGDYEILDEIARGGMGVVYKARQNSLNRPVALKMILSAQLASEADVQRFHIEAEAAAKLEHPGIVPIHEVGEHDGQHFFSMALVEGGSLSDLVSDGPLVPKQAAELVRSISEALQYAHSRNIVHRDLKPANVLLDEQGSPKVTDFGLAKDMQENSGLTTDGQIMGTPSYMPPEQAAGNVDEVGPLADVYSLGAILYYLATGRPPFQANSVMGTLRQVLMEEPDTPRQHNPAVDLDLATVCLKCLEKDPNRRYGSAGELADELGRYIRHEPIVARPLGRTARFGRWCRRNPVVASLIALVTVLLVAVAIGAMWTAQRERNLRAVAVTAQHEAQDRLVRQYVANGVRLMDEGDLLGSLPLFVEALRLDKNNPLREKMHRYRIASVLQQSPKPIQIWFHAEPVVDAQFSSDGQRVVTCAGQTARVWDTESGEALTPPLPHEGVVLQASFNAEAGFVVTACDDGVARVWVLASDEPTCVRLNHDGAVSHAVFSPNGTHVATASQDKTVRVWDAVSGEPVSPPLPHPYGVHCVSFSPGGRRLVAACGKPVRAYFGSGEARLWDAVTGEAVADPLHHDGNVTFACFSPDGQRVVTAGDDFVARVWDTGDGRLLMPPLKHIDMVTHAEFSPDGRRLATASDDDTVRVWDAETGEAMIAPLKHPGEVRRISFSPDGRRIATACHAGTAHVWDSITGEPAVARLVHSGPVDHVAFSPDGHRIVTGSRDRTARIWDLAAAEPDVRQLSHSARIRAASFSPDGHRVVTASYDGTARVWDSDTGAAVTPLLQHNGRVTFATFHPTDDLVVTACADGTARVWDAATGEHVSQRLEHSASVNSATFNPEGDKVVTACADRTAQVWNWSGGTLAIPELNHDANVGSASFSPDGRLIATISDSTVRLWDAQTGKQVGKPIDHSWPVFSATFSPDGSCIATACGEQLGEGGGQARIWDTSTTEPVTPPLTHLHGVGHISFDPDGRRVVTASFDDSARVWDADSGNPLTSPLQHAGDLLHAEFSEDGLRVATASDDRTARVWDAATGEPVTPPFAHGFWVRKASLSPDGSHLLTISMDASARLFQLPLELRPVEDLESLAELLTARRLLDSGSFIALDSDEYEKTWRSFQRKYTNDFMCPKEKVTVWHQQELLDCRIQRHWYGVVWHLGPLIQLQPDQVNLHRRRAHAYAELSKWDLATIHFARAIELGASERQIGYSLALSRLANGDTKEYRQTCSDLLASVKETDDWNTVNSAVWTCVVSPDSVADATQLVKLGERLLEESPNRAAVLNTLGAACYRAGQFEAASGRLTQSIELSNEGGSAWDWLFLAMAKQKLGQTNEAKEWFAKVVEWIDRETNERTQGQLGARLSWEQRLELQALRREFELMQDS